MEALELYEAKGSERSKARSNETVEKWPVE